MAVQRAFNLAITLKNSEMYLTYAGTVRLYRKSMPGM